MQIVKYILTYHLVICMFKTGDYVLEISTTQDTDTILTVTAQSYPRSPSAEVFTATAWTHTESFEFSPSTPVVLYSSVQKGVSPVLDADVTMVVEDSEGHFINVALLDDGQGTSVCHLHEIIPLVDDVPFSEFKPKRN